MHRNVILFIFSHKNKKRLKMNLKKEKPHKPYAHRLVWGPFRIPVRIYPE